MLQEIHVKNLALIDELLLEFHPCFNVLTGETGAGKSIIIDALGLALGGRFSAEMLRSGAESVVVEAFFAIDNRTEFQDFLTENGIPLEPDQTLLIQREINSSGKNRCRVNGQLVTVLSLTKIGEYLIDLHGQHEHQSLLFPEKQLELLDQYAGAQCLTVKNQFAAAYRDWQKILEEYRALQTNEAELARRVELLEFQLQEINQAQLVIGEDEDLLKEREILSSSEKLFEAAALSYQVLYDSNEGKAAVELLVEAERTIEQVAFVDPRLVPILETLREAACQTEEVSRELRAYQNEIQFDPDRLHAINDRLDEISRLKRKYGATTADVLLYGERSARELAGINQREERSQQLQAELEKCRIRLGNLAEELTGLRAEGAARLDQAITMQLADLNMAKTQFKIELFQNEATEGVPYQDREVAVSITGADRVDFLVAPNPGEGLKPLSKIASGGELSRLMLALKTILAELDQIPTMVFDEIDVGIGGRTAQAVAEKMLLIGQARQVICVTHLPQIASLAERHFYIEKQVIDDRTVVTVRPLAMNERVLELARMLSGAEVTETTRQHAREMLTLAEKLRLKRVGRNI